MGKLTRDEALERLVDIADDSPSLDFEEEILACVAVLSWPCACEGRKPIAVQKGHFYEDGGPGFCDLALEEWVEIARQDVEVLVFALPAEETA